jgi:mannose/cellobiose epimerase-like protein (N-acyl-D-glucosamine 2-epimerase family)
MEDLSMTKRALVLASLLVALGGCATHDSAKHTGAYGAIYEGVVAAHAPAPTAKEYQALHDEIETSLTARYLPFFYPQTLDQQNGGFYHALPADWAKLPAKDRVKNTVFQARLAWTAAEVAHRRPDLHDEYIPYARHGLAFLKDKLWDKENGGFFWIVDEAGNPLPSNTDKHSYANAFGIYAAAAVYEATKDPQALQLAMDAFQWLERHGHDAKNGGYFEAYTREGSVITSADKSFDPANPNDTLGNPYGYKSMNAHIHLMEALATLYRVNPDPLVKRRFDEVFLIVRDKIAVQPGALNLVFTPNWKPIPLYDSFGHDVETAYLLIEADMLRQPTHQPNSKTRQVARSLVDHALQFGWDDTSGGFYYEGFAFGKPHNRAKSWWTQAEGLNALLLMHEYFGKDDPKYWRAFLHQWSFIKNCQIAPSGAWYSELNPDGSMKSDSLINPWQASYHAGRAMLNVSDRLAELAK